MAGTGGEAAGPAGVRGVQRARLLLGADSDDVLLIWEASIRHGLDENVELRLARDGQEALEAVRTGFDPDVIVTGLMMPRLGGKEALRRLRIEGYAGAVVVCSNAIDFGVDLSGLAVDAALPKGPPSELLEAIRSALDRPRPGLL